MKFYKFLFLTFCITFWVLLASCRPLTQTNQPNQTAVSLDNKTVDLTPEQSSESNLKFPLNNVELPKAIDVSTRADDVQLAQKISETIEQSPFKNARWGVFVASLKDGRVLVAQDAQKTFNPASTEKLLTTAVAMDKMGANYRWKTSVLANNQIGADGTLNGDLVLYGRGAPDFDEKSIATLTAQLRQRGLRRVAGNIIGDASFFHADNLGDGWVWNEAQWYYGAEPSALSYSDNTVLVEIAANGNGDEVTVKTTPPADFVRIGNTAKSSGKGTDSTVGIHRDLDSNDIEVWGDVPRRHPFGARITMHAPQLWAADALRKSLQATGVQINGQARGDDWRTTTIEAAKLTEIAAVQSETLTEIVRRTNKRSVNLNAELMLRALGANARNTIENKQTIMLGDDLLGALTIKNWLAEKGVATGETEIHDGSGLSRLDFISPETMGRLLIHATKMRDFTAFKDSLPIAGTDGTLSGRLPKFKNRIFAKTGTVTYVNALAGYAQISNDETLAFVIFCNNEVSKENSVGTIDKVAGLIAEGNIEK